MDKANPGNLETKKPQTESGKTQPKSTESEGDMKEKYSSGPSQLDDFIKNMENLGYGKKS